ncbi:hypothetical protein KJB30_17765 [Geobacter chapellei]|uniref:Uncharacterized protein n=1 Tax=Pelotalea chapellei TaxID=44671 RepID=A0ABS5UD97_9BACT|nr:hypothetical protein [Pelotalea chapellei]MBT1073626.1 hypothetical protein [Pelotalea chapellei]
MQATIERDEDLSIDFIMAADIEQDNLLLGDQQGQGDAVGIGQPDGGGRTNTKSGSGRLAGC